MLPKKVKLREAARKKPVIIGKLAEAMSVGELENIMWDAVQERFGEKAWAHRIYVEDGYVIVDLGSGKFLKVEYTLEDGAVVLAANTEPVQKKEEFIPLNEALNFSLIEAKDKEGRIWKAVIIHAGKSGNNCYYPPEALQAAVPLFEGVRALARTDEEHLRDVNRSVKDIVGWFSNPRFEGDKIVADFHVSEAADWLRVLLLDAWEQGKKDMVGFSIVAEGVARKKKMGQSWVTYVDSIEKVFTVDVVLNPAAGGKFLKLVAGQPIPGDDSQQQEDVKVDKKQLLALIGAQSPGLLKDVDREKITVEGLTQLLTEAAAREGESQGAAKTILAEAETAKKAADEAGKAATEKLTGAQKAANAAHDALVEVKAVTLSAKLAEAKLPEIATARIKKLYEGQLFELKDLEQSITDERAYLAQLSESGRVQGCGHALTQSGLSGLEQFQFALDRAVGLEVPSEATGIPRLRGGALREAYIMFTGDTEINGRIDRNLSQLREAFDSTTFTQILGNTLNRRMLRDYNAVDYKERLLFSVRPGVSDFKQQTAIRQGYFGNIDTVDPETDNYQELAAYSEEAPTYTVGQKGNIITITRKHIKNDDLGTVATKVGRLGRAARRTFAEWIWAFVTGNGNIWDGTALFVGGHSNITTSALTYLTLHAAAVALAKMTEPGSSKSLGWPVGGKFNLFIPVDLRATAIVAVESEDVPGGGNNDKNPAYKIADTHIIPAITDTNNYYVGVPKEERDFIEVAFMDGNEEPEFFVSNDPNADQMFIADKMRYKVRHEYGGAVVDYRSMYGGIVAGG